MGKEERKERPKISIKTSYICQVLQKEFPGIDPLTAPLDGIVMLPIPRLKTKAKRENGVEQKEEKGEK